MSPLRSNSVPPLSERDLRRLRIFRAVAQANGFTAAEQGLGIERSTISREIKALEERLGARLCERGPGGFKVTEFGAAALAAAATIADTMDRVRNELNSASRLVVGELHLGVADNCLTNPMAHIPAALTALMGRAPEIDLHLTIGTPAQLVEGLLARRLHAVISGALPERAKVNSVRLFSEEFRLYVAVPHGKAAPRIEELGRRGYGFIVREAEPRTPSASELGLGTRRQVDASGLEAVVTLIATGQFVGLLPTHLISGVNTPYRFVEVAGAEHLSQRLDFLFITESARSESPAVQIMRDEAVRAHGAEPAHGTDYAKMVP